MAEPTSTELLNRLDDAVDTAEALIESITGATAQIGNAVHKTGAETITGEKTFSVSPLVPTPAATDASQKVANMAALAPVRTTANEAKTTAEAALPTSGGKMTGDIAFGVSIGNAGKGINFNNAQDQQIAYARAIYSGSDSAGNYNALILNARDRDVSGTVRKSNSLGLRINQNGDSTIWMSEPEFELSGNSTLASRQWARGYARQKAIADTDIFIGGSGVSDTADLGLGRGLTADKPFASPAAAVAWVMANIEFVPGKRPIFRIQQSMTLEGLTITAPTGSGLVFQGEQGVILTMTAPIYVNGGMVRFQTLGFNADNIAYLFSADASGALDTKIVLHSGLSLTGSVQESGAVVRAINGATVQVTGSLTGDINGSRYKCQFGSRILTGGKGENAIPGTQDGTKDASSVYC